MYCCMFAVPLRAIGADERAWASVRAEVSDAGDTQTPVEGCTSSARERAVRVHWEWNGNFKIYYLYNTNNYNNYIFCKNNGVCYLTSGNNQSERWIWGEHNSARWHRGHTVDTVECEDIVCGRTDWRWHAAGASPSVALSTSACTTKVLLLIWLIVCCTPRSGTPEQ